MCIITSAKAKRMGCFQYIFVSVMLLRNFDEIFGFVVQQGRDYMFVAVQLFRFCTVKR